MTIFKKSLVTLSTITALALTGCGSGGSSNQPDTVTGVLADGAIGNASYECGTTTGFTTADGKFTCPTGSSVDFYYGNIKLGGVSTLPSDKIVLIQDVLDINRSDVNNSVVTRLAVFLQSMDNDSNHSNGIFLNPNDISSITSKVDFTTFNDTNVTSLISTAGKREFTQTEARANLQAVTNNVIDFQNINGEVPNTDTPVVPPSDTTAPTTPTLSSVANMTREDSVAVVVTGEVGAKIYVNGTNTGEVIGADGTKGISLDTSGALGTKTFDIIIQDSNDNNSSSTSLSINKKAPCLTLSSINYNGNILSSSNYLGLGSDYNLTVQLSGNITSAGLSISSSSDTNATVGTLATPLDTNVSFSYNAPSSLFSGTADYNATDTLSIVHDECSAITASVPLYKKYYAPVANKDALLALIDDYTTKYNADPNAADTVAAAALIVNADTSNITDMNRLLVSKSTFNLDISDWNTSNVINMSQMFYGVSAFNQNISEWNTSKVENMSYMFNSATSFNQNIGSWDTSEVETMQNMFAGASSFNKPLDFNTSSITSMSAMFYGTTSFNQALNFNTSRVTSMNNMFGAATSFNQALNFNTSSVENMSNMFGGAIAFNQPLTFSDTSSVTSMTNMFNGATAFNQDLNFNTSSVKYMTNMFKGATAFNQDISSWTTSSVTNMAYMFQNATAFNQDLSIWDTSSVTSHTDFSTNWGGGTEPTWF